MTDRPLLSPFNIVLIVVLALLTLAGFVLVPLEGNLPIHWGLDGRADGFAPAPLALLLPALMAAIVLGALFGLRAAGFGKDLEAGRHLNAAATSFILLLAIGLLGGTIAIGMGFGVDMPRLIAFLLGAMLLVLGNYLPKTQPNVVAGIRLPWTLNDPVNWRVTHRWAGRLTMLGGAVALVAALINPPPAILICVVIAAFVLPMLASIAISYALTRR